MLSIMIKHEKKPTKILLSQRHAIFYFISVWEKRVRRRITWSLDKKKYTCTTKTHPLEYRVKKHQSRLLKKLGNTEMWMQHNKIENLKIAISKINGVIIKPGETFSFYRNVGRPTKRKGYKMGMELSNGKPQPGIGGGICQIANLLHWLSLHSPLTINERHHHSIDPFPDDGRVLPWASGAAVFYNYIDFQLTNLTENEYQINLWLSDKCLEGEIRSNKNPVKTYHIFEKEHAFIKDGNNYYRTNEIWRESIDKTSGNKIGVEMISKNLGKVMYVPKSYVSAKTFQS